MTHYVSYYVYNGHGYRIGTVKAASLDEAYALAEKLFGLHGNVSCCEPM